MSTLTVNGISKSFYGVKAVQGVSFEIGPGQIMALIGPNGAGKSTCFNMLNGQLRPDTGSVTFGGHDITGSAPSEIWRHGVGRTFQIAQTFGSMTVRENVQMVLHSVNRRLWGLWSPLMAGYAAEADELLEAVGMQEQADRACCVLAYGDVKRLELAMALANRPRLLLMDEPTAGMAPKERNELMSLTARLVTERGLSVLFTEHSVDVVFEHANTVVVMSRGQLIARGTPEEIREDPLVQEVYLGSGAFLETSGIGQ
ncbi:branched-chain amino acid transport system ATP-binding protein [Pseudochelatococcus lubricantis]|uniref:Branched-chain amino acid transport system ATP-binding protein n=1 Tax=Pseudochelatococcus lubricantis TaxID=1538102 RepID=A0ABX0V0U6_9HYPH|nr:ABC transporter ATP-binding protein [Pseudochelatococcus lubricantis]NIJ58778.1 branched-chain amino acid transport system ATP-binding protein [Pseudochelatococcus lubricantis]